MCLMLYLMVGLDLSFDDLVGNWTQDNGNMWSCDKEHNSYVFCRADFGKTASFYLSEGGITVKDYFNSANYGKLIEKDIIEFGEYKWVRTGNILSNVCMFVSSNEL